MCATLHTVVYSTCAHSTQTTYKTHSLVQRCTTENRIQSCSYLDLLGTMTFYHSVELLLIAFATTTLGAHTVKGDASEEEYTNTGGCISDWKALKKAYLEHQSSANVENSIFDFYPSDAVKYGVLVMFYDVGPPPNISTSGRRECCQRESKDCIIHFLYRFTVFRDFHPRLLHGRAGHAFKSTSAYKTNQLCWAPPPLCSNSSEKMLYEFSTQVHLDIYVLLLFTYNSCG